MNVLQLIDKTICIGLVEGNQCSSHEYFRSCKIQKFSPLIPIGRA